MNSYYLKPNNLNFSLSIRITSKWRQNDLEPLNTEVGIECRRLECVCVLKYLPLRFRMVNVTASKSSGGRR